MKEINERRSIREYKDIRLNDEIIKKIIVSGMMAPTACNMQNYKFIVINDNNKIKQLIENGTASFIKENMDMILVLYSKKTNNVEYKDNIQSGAAVIENMILEATNLEISSCWVCNLPRKKIMRKIFSIPKYYDIIGLVTLGYSDKLPGNKKLKYSFEEVVSYNEYKETSKNIDRTIPIIYSLYKCFSKYKFIKKIGKRFEKKF
ncbi:MAG: nitroreductase family protein [Bacilli bacterium]|nr:nitroreductase family protein [Bacilli bacterium]